jgi:hypothetical protein
MLMGFDLDAEIVKNKSETNTGYKKRIQLESIYFQKLMQ